MFSVIITTVIYQCQEGKIKIIEKNDILRKDRQRRYTDYDFFKDGKPGCRGAGDSHLPRSMRARSPHGLFSRRRGDVVLCTTNLRSWIAADATHLHHTVFIKTANSVCQGAGDSHLPRSPHGLFPGGGFRATHDQLTQLDRGRCKAPAPYYFCFLNKIQRI